SAYSAATFSSIGASALHGPHHSAQKSRITSLSRDGSTTSCRKRSTAFCSSRPRPLPAPFQYLPCAVVRHCAPLCAIVRHCVPLCGRCALDNVALAVDL